MGKFVDIFKTNKKYDIVYADPPWIYKDKGLAGNRGSCCKYSVMNIEQICSLPVKEILSDNAVLFLWVTLPQIMNAEKVINAFGFKYKTCAFTWVKRNKKSSSWFWGLGSWTRSNAELCLLATRGKPKRVNAGVHSVIDSPIGKHSAKPPEVRERIVTLMGDLPRIELFARDKVDEWDCWGDDFNIK